jgi:tRNA pseudouridine38-40 synthase
LRYFAEISYKGYSYHGWQRQPKVLTIQQVMEENLSLALGQPMLCIGCGRTDAMVHASQFFFHFDYYSEIDFDLTFRLNKMLPNDISIVSISPVNEPFHAQFSTIWRTYDYFIHTQKNPFLNEISALYESNFDLQNMFKATKAIALNSDFKNTCRCPSRHSSTICNIKSTSLYATSDKNMIRFQITANRFLQGMVRLLSQRLIDVGTGELSLEDFELLLSNKKTPKKVKAAHPQGLYLSSVIYPFPTTKTSNESRFQNFLANFCEWKLIQ